MELSIMACLFVLDTKKSENIKKSDIKKLKILVDKETKDLVRIPFDNKTDIKELIRKKITDIMGSKIFHLEQVYTFGESKYFSDNKIDVIYLALTNIENINKLSNDYELVDFEVIDNKEVIFDNQRFSYKTKVKKVNKNLEYYHEFNIDDIFVEKKLIELITAFKQLRFKADDTDICFKLLPNEFTLEDVQSVYELIKDTTVDKSNFRKKISKYCEKTDAVIRNKGYRPTQVYRFVSNDNIWI